MRRRQLHERGRSVCQPPDRVGRRKRKSLHRPDDVDAAVAVGPDHSGKGSLRHRAQQGWEGTRDHGGRIRL